MKGHRCSRRVRCRSGVRSHSGGGSWSQQCAHGPSSQARRRPGRRGHRSLRRKILWENEENAVAHKFQDLTAVVGHRLAHQLKELAETCEKCLRLQGFCVSGEVPEVGESDRGLLRGQVTAMKLPLEHPCRGNLPNVGAQHLSNQIRSALKDKERASGARAAPKPAMKSAGNPPGR